MNKIENVLIKSTNNSADSVLLLQYKPQNDDDDDNNTNSVFYSNNKHKKYSKLRDIMSDIMIRIKLIRPKTIKAIVLFLFIFFLLSFAYYNAKSYSIYNDKYVYSVVIDAGSTGSRIHVFRFIKNNNPGTMSYNLVNEELFHAIKPGLSSYADNPLQAADSLKPLLDLALAKIPSHIHKLTRISLKATAGLRLISEQKADIILDNVEKLFTRYPFYMKPDEDVSILDGKYEGIYSWITLNYAKDAFKNSEEISVCSLDLGGGSTQVTFVPSTIDQNKFSDDLVDFKLDKMSYKIFAKSFLGYGMMSARLSILQTESNTATSTNLSSVCISKSVKTIWKQQNVEYKLSGSDRSEQNYDDCLINVLKIIENKLNAPNDLKTKTIYAFSFYYDRLQHSNLITEEGGVVNIEAIQSKAKDACDISNKNKYENVKDAEFLCMDLTFIFALLHNGFGLPLDKELRIHKEINKMEINWALGAAFHMLN